MDETDLDTFTLKMGEPGPKEEEFFARRRALGLGVGLDENGKLVHQKGPVFIDFVASSVSENSWPVEVGVSWLEGNRVETHSRLIQPRPDWPEEDWDIESAKVHQVPRSDLNTAEPADAVKEWLTKTVAGRALVSDAPSFDQRWLNRLLNATGPKILDFDELARVAFSENGALNPGQLHLVYKTLARRDRLHRAGEIAANLCRAWQAGSRR